MRLPHLLGKFLNFSISVQLQKVLEPAWLVTAKTYKPQFPPLTECILRKMQLSENERSILSLSFERFIPLSCTCTRDEQTHDLATR